MIQNPAQPLLHYDKEKGIKYVNNIPYLEERDIKYLLKKIPEIEKIAEECREKREDIEKIVFNAGGLKQQVKEISIKIEEDKKYFKPDLEDSEKNFKQFVLDFESQTALRIESFNQDIDKLMNQPLCDKNLIEETLQLIKDTRDQSEKIKYTLKRTQIFHRIGIGILVYFMTLIVFDAFIWTKNHSGKLLVFAFKAINLTGFRSNESEM